MSSFKLVFLLLAAILFISAYFFKLHLHKLFTQDKNEIKRQKILIEELEADLKSCREQGAEYKQEIIRLKSGASNGPDALKTIDGEGQIKIKEEDTETPTEGFVAPTESIAQEKGEEEREVPSKSASKFEALKDENLQIIEGIGPKMEAVLKDNGVKTWAQLGDQTDTTLRSILENYGNKYKIIDPSSWHEQARLAANGKWSQLVRMQKGLDVGRGVITGDTPAKIEKVMIKLGIIKEYKLDDLKAIEGIGPKIAELLNEAGINSWRDLAQTSIQSLQKILDNAGKRFQLADPGTWPKQAELADAGKFDELSDYQDYLQGGS